MRHRHLRSGSAGVALVAMLAFIPAAPAAAHCDEGVCEQQGCTPGYWKNHHASWQFYAPGTTVGEVFFYGSWLDTHTQYASFAGHTFDDALAYGGGGGVEGATMILLRSATAALLNAGHSDVSYFTPNRPQIIVAVRNALASNDRQTILALAQSLDAANNAVAGCPL